MQLGATLVWMGTGPAASAEPKGVAVVEVFTSEGCSSCPPAEQMLEQLDERGGRGGSTIIGLEWHVDYWDYLGWKDQFGSADATKRQYQYARTLPSQVYTPQAVINGTKVPEYAGDVGEVEALVHQALIRAPEGRIGLSIIPGTHPEAVVLRVTAEGVTSDTRILAVLVEDGLHSKPTAGENRGQELRHTHVVRRSQLYEKAGNLQFDLVHGIDRAKTSVVVMLQDQRSLRILAAVRARLPGQVSPSQGQSWSGSVVDRLGLPRARVALQACSERLCVPGVTNERGEFSFPFLPPGRYSLTVGTSKDVMEVVLVAEPTNPVVTRVVVP